MDKINIHIGSGFDSSGVREARKTLTDFQRKLMESDKWLMQINAEMSDKMHALAQRIAVDYGAAVSGGRRSSSTSSTARPPGRVRRTS